MRAAPTPKPIVAVAAVRSILPVRSGNTSLDSRIGLCIRTASSQVEAALDRRLTGGAYVDLFRTAQSGSNSYDLFGAFNESGLQREVRMQRFVLRAPAVDPAGFDVRYDTRRVFGDDTVINPELYTVDYEAGILFLTADTAPLMDALRVSYLGGFNRAGTGTALADDGVLDPPPEAIQTATITQAVHLYTRMTPDNIGVEADRGAGKVETGRFTNRGGLCGEAASLVASSGLRFVKVGSG